MEDNRLETVDEELLNEISDYNGEFKGAYNIRKNGKGIQRKVTEKCDYSLYKNCDYPQPPNDRSSASLSVYFSLSGAASIPQIPLQPIKRH